MPTAPLKPCRRPGCPALVESGYCPKHDKPKVRKDDKLRPSSAKRGYDRKWRKARHSYLEQNPMCVECAKANRIAAAVIVDHVKPHRNDMILFWDRSNWQGLCKRCHAIKTAKGE